MVKPGLKMDYIALKCLPLLACNGKPADKEGCREHWYKSVYITSTLVGQQKEATEPQGKGGESGITTDVVFLDGHLTQELYSP